MHTTMTVLAESAGAQGFGFVLMAVILAALLGYVVLFIAAVVSILASPADFTVKIACLIFALVAPFLGSLCWFLVLRKRLMFA